jgi:aspartyl-tRNA(Asn)/glutamyl-tRNA(Gln) amidotransferase subunit A
MPDPSLRDLQASVVTGEATAEALCEAALARIEAVNGTLNAFNLVDGDRARARARDIDRRRASGAPLGPLAGIPVAVKDNLCVRGMRTTASSRILDRYVPPYDATVITRLEAAGAVIVAKTNCDEFAMGSSNENSAYGAVRNPWSHAHAPGGSSGGAAVAVAARCVPLSIGSDTGGSIRQPAALCGVTGLKPTYGRVSRYGLIAFASSLDQIGPITRTVADAAWALTAIAGPDPADATAAPQPVPDFTEALDGTIAGLRVGVPRAFVSEGVAADVRRAFDEALARLRDMGATLVDIELPHARFAIPVYYLVCTAEASSNLARYDGVRYGFRAASADTLDTMYRRTRDEGFGPEVKRRIMLGTYVLSAGYYDAFYLKAQQVRTLLRRDYDQAFASVDVVATPTTPTTAFRLGEKTDDPLEMYLADVFTVSAPLAGLPAISVPCGLAETPDASGTVRLPVGLHLTGRAFDEPTLLRAADAYQRTTDWHTIAPSTA